MGKGRRTDVVVVLRVVDVVGLTRGDAVVVRVVALEAGPVERPPVFTVWVGVRPVVKVLRVLTGVWLLPSSAAHLLFATAFFADDGLLNDLAGEVVDVISRRSRVGRSYPPHRHLLRRT